MEKISTKKIIFWGLIGCFVLLAFFSGYMIIKEYIPRSNPAEGYRSEISSVGEKTEDVVLPDNPVDFEGLKQRNDDVCAWIHIPGSEQRYGIAIDYPILRSGDDKEEDFYLNHDLDGNTSSDGSVYIQKMNDKAFTDRNTVIYGHDLRNKTMFSALRGYRTRQFFDNNQYIYIYTPGHILKYHIYSAFMYDDRHLMYSFDFRNKGEYGAFLSETLNPTSSIALVREGVEVTTDDYIITLSTCADRETDRFLVVGVLVEDTLTK